VIQYLPGFNLFRIPARWMMVVNLAIAVLGGLGLDILRRSPLPRRALGGILLLALLLLLGQALLWFFRADLLAWAGQFDSRSARLLTNHLEYALTVDPVYQDRLWLRRLTWLTSPALWAMLNAGLAIGLLMLVLVRKRASRSLTMLAVLLVALDMALAGGTTINPIRPAEWWQRLSGGAAYVLEHLEAQHRVFPLGVSSETLSISHLGQYFPSLHRLNSASGYASPLRLARYDALLDEANPVRGLQVLAVRYLLTPGQMGSDVAATFPLVYQDEESYVYEIPNALPRAFIVPQAVVADDAEAVLTQLNDFSLDLRQTVILELEPGQPPPPATFAPWPSGESATATIISETPQTAEIEVTLPGDGYLVLLDTYYPGWQATLDGQPISIYRANYLGRAVPVPAGEHVIRFEYRPLSFRLGVWLALLTLMVMILLIVRQR
jgi:hypothetical protein